MMKNTVEKEVKELNPLRKILTLLNLFNGVDIMGKDNFCDTSILEIEEIKKRAQDILRRFDELSHDKQKSIFVYHDNLKKTIREIEDRIDRSMIECPSKWDEQDNEFESELLELKRKYQELLSKIPSEFYVG